MKPHPWTSWSIFAILNVVVVERCRCVASTAGRAQGNPLPTSTPDCCCPLVSTDGMNIFLNFADSITLSLIILSTIHPCLLLSLFLSNMYLRQDNQGRVTGTLALR